MQADGLQQSDQVGVCVCVCVSSWEVQWGRFPSVAAVSLRH